MPLGLKELETGHYVLYVVSLNLCLHEDVSYTCHFHNDERIAQNIHRRLQQHMQEHDCWAAGVADVILRKEMVIFDGSMLHSLRGRTYDLGAVERSMHRINEYMHLPNEDWILAIFGESRRQLRPVWQRVLLDMTSLCCCVRKSYAVDYED